MEKDWVYLTSPKNPKYVEETILSDRKVAVLDFGSKENILRELQMRCSEIKIFNSRSTVQDILAYNPDGIMLTNGPGDPPM